MKIKDVPRIVLITGALALSACGGSSDSAGNNESGPPAASAAVAQQRDVTFDLNLSAFLEKEIARDVFSDPGANAANLMAGTMQVTNLATGDVELHPWTVNIDENDLGNVQSFQTLALVPGDYAFELALSKAAHSYGGAIVHTLADGATDQIAMTIRPVIGDSQINVNAVAELIDFKFSYSEAEINTANLTNPSLGITIDNNPEQIFVLDPGNGLSEHMLLNLVPGTYNISLRLLDSGLQVGKSIAAQEQNISVSQGLDVSLDIIPLHGEFALLLAVEGGDATVNLQVPPEVVEEAGGLGNLQAVLSVAGPTFPLQELPVNLLAAGADFTAATTLTDVLYGDLTFEMLFSDLTTGEELGYCVNSLVLDNSDVSLDCALTLRRRQIVSGSLMSTLGINVSNANGTAAAGAVISIDDNEVAITNSAAFSTEGYSKLYVKPGNYTVRAQLGAAFGEVSYDSLPLAVANISMVLDQLDTDGDGVADSADACPDEAAETATGCPSDLKAGLITGRSSSTASNSEVQVWLNDGQGGLSNVTHHVNPLQSHFVAAGDLNQDGIDDVIASNNSGGLLVALGPFGGGVSLVQVATMSHINNHTAPIGLADFNNDDVLDVVVLGFAQHRVLLGVGDGTFGPEISVPGHITAGHGSVATADLDGDGNIDFVTNSTAGAAMLAIHYGDGSGNFTSDFADTFGGKLTADNVHITDIDTDGDPDIVIGGWGHSVKVFDNNGGRNFTEGLVIPIDSSAGGAMYILVAEDLNEDGAPDLVSATANNPSIIEVRLNDGSGGFGSATTYTGSTGARHGVVFDINADGKKDVAIANIGTAADSITIMQGNGDGTFQTPYSLPGSNHTLSIDAGNFD
ncbi:hypothetical protein AB833_02655 [Chromatiales bacterium (ex Bugula neritina AB1)]|nr:hypothetical protein AB833_02655 [Chromatiales bacterium (ex Bugula neritina AB1)]